MKIRDLVWVAVLLVIGTVLYLFMPKLGAVTPDMVVTFAALAILLVRPRLWVSLGIGIVAGLLAMFFSKSSIAWFNIPVHTVGAWVTALVALRLGKLLTGPVDWKPAVGALAYGAVSGGLFVTALLIAGILPLQAYVPEGWVPVLLSTLSSIIIDMILYPPAQWLYERIK